MIAHRSRSACATSASNRDTSKQSVQTEWRDDLMTNYQTTTTRLLNRLRRRDDLMTNYHTAATRLLNRLMSRDRTQGQKCYNCEILLISKSERVYRSLEILSCAMLQASKSGALMGLAIVVDWKRSFRRMPCKLLANRRVASSSDRTYCHIPTCSAFIKPDHIVADNNAALCPKRKHRTCSDCKNAYHCGECRRGRAVESVLNVVGLNGNNAPCAVVFSS